MEVELIEERNPAIRDSQVVEVTLHLKGVTLRAREASEDMVHSINLAAEDLPARSSATARSAASAARRTAPRLGWPRLRSSPVQRLQPGRCYVSDRMPLLRPAPSASARARSSRSSRRRSRASTTSSPSSSSSPTRSCARATTRCASARTSGESLDDLLFESFALTREAAKRTLGQRHFDVQLIGGMVLHDGSIAEMKTGEGKTLTATLPIALNALAARDEEGNPVQGKGVHLVTVNDYLARRDALWMKPIYDLLGVTVGIIQSDERDLDEQARRLRRPTSPTAPTPSSASTTCATTSPPTSQEKCPARPRLRDRRRGRQHPHRRGAHAADHLRRRPSRPPTSTTSSPSSPR